MTTFIVLSKRATYSPLNKSTCITDTHNRSICIWAKGSKQKREHNTYTSEHTISHSRKSNTSPSTTCNNLTFLHSVPKRTNETLYWNLEGKVNFWVYQCTMYRVKSEIIMYVWVFIKIHNALMFLSHTQF